jgi:hypothetical protein
VTEPVVIYRRCPLEDCEAKFRDLGDWLYHLTDGHEITEFIDEITRLRVELAAVTQTLAATVERGGLWTP